LAGFFFAPAIALGNTLRQMGLFRENPEMQAYRSILRTTALAAVLAVGVGAGQALAQGTLKVVMHSDLKILDPIWTTAYIVRNHGYMVWDTLFAMDDKVQIKPQMVEKHEVSADKLTYTFTLRDGLKWHDGQAVTPEDCIASIKRWGAKDSMGQKLLSFVAEMKPVDAKTFTLTLKEPYGLVLESLGKPSSNVPFMMPKRIAETDPNTQISDFIGSGPFVFKKDEWKPGDKTVYVKNAEYKPRAEAPSWLSGGKKVNVDRVEWLAIPDHQTAINALLASEIDFMESPPHDLLPILKKEKSVTLFNSNTLGNQFTFRFNWTHPPFNNEKIRRAALAALNQEEILKGQIGDAEYYKTCKSLFICGTPLESTAGTEGLLEGNAELSKKLLKEANYDGTPIVLMHSTDLAVLVNLAPVAKANLEKGGFKVDMQSMDWQTLVSRRTKKDPLNAGGWSAFLTSWVAADILNPVMAGFVNSACDKAMFGWPCDEKMEKLRDDFARTTDPAKQKEIAAAVQVRAMEIGTHAHAGQWYSPVAFRKDAVSGVVGGPVPVFWNIQKKGK
jgi:peptide/nickel transport system substrate-binding protein